MSRRILATVLSVVGVVTVGVLWWLRSFSSPAGPETPTAAQLSAASLPATPGNLMQATPNGRKIPRGEYEPSDPRWKEVHAKDSADKAWEWKMPINFYGRVVDENEKPVPGAQVDLSWTDLSQAGSSQAKEVTDEQGAFSLFNRTGRNLEVWVSKDGYYTPRRQQISFDYAAFWEANYHVADPNNPVIFHLRKRQQVDALTRGETRPTLPIDGTPVRLDLLNGGRVSANGQLEISAVTNTEKYPPSIFSWRANISVPAGGLMEHNSEFPFEAPDGGYQPSVEFDMPANAPDWKRVIEKSYFIVFGSPPKYGRIQIRLNGGSQKVSVSYWVNPNGSRNLEAPLDAQASSR